MGRCDGSPGALICSPSILSGVRRDTWKPKANPSSSRASNEPSEIQAGLEAVLATLQPGQAVDVTYMSKDGTSHTVKVTLGELPG